MIHCLVATWRTLMPGIGRRDSPSRMATSGFSPTGAPRTPANTSAHNPVATANGP
jgi:hypothetical protein